MAQKAIVGKTNKYSGLARKVQSSQPPIPQEPRITPAQVISAFHSFHYEPNQQGMNDVGYWSTRGQSEGPKLMEELRKRRLDDNAKVDNAKSAIQSKMEDIRKRAEDQTRSKQTLPRLSDADILKLHDEYGLPAPDAEWARNNLPNDPEKVRNILSVQRKTADEMIKKHMKNMVNSMPEVPKAGSPSTTSTAVMPPNNNGIPPGSGGIGGPDTGVISKPFFVGDHAVVRITNPQNPNSSTLWLVDQKKKVLRPFNSSKAFENAFEDPEEAKNSITTLSSQALGQGGPLDGFTPLNSQQGVQSDGSMGNIKYSPAQLAQRYGKPSDPAAEQKGLSVLDALFAKLGASQQK